MCKKFVADQHKKYSQLMFKKYDTVLPLNGESCNLKLLITSTHTVPKSNYKYHKRLLAQILKVIPYLYGNTMQENCYC